MHRIVIYSAYRHNLRPDEAEGGLRRHRPPAQEAPFGTRYTVELHEGPGVLPVTEAQPIVARGTAEVDDNAQDDETDNGQNLEGR